MYSNGQYTVKWCQKDSSEGTEDQPADRWHICTPRDQGAETVALARSHSLTHAKWAAAGATAGEYIQAPGVHTGFQVWKDSDGQSQQHNLKQMFLVIDTDSSGSLSRGELASELKKSTELDEILRSVGKTSHKLFEALDVDGTFSGQSIYIASKSFKLPCFGVD